MLCKRTLLMVTLLAFSLITIIPSGTAQQYTLTVDAAYESTVVAYENSVKLTPEQQQLVPEVIGVYQSASGAPGGAKQDTPAEYAGLNEGTVYDVKVPISANVTYQGNWWTALFEHWEVWDQDGTPELQWITRLKLIHPYQYKAIYTGTFPGGYTRITKILPYPTYVRTPIRPEVEHNLEQKYSRTPKELLDRSDGILEPYLRFSINNTVGGGNKKLLAVYYLGWGPETEHSHWKTITNPATAVTAFLNKQIDITFDLTQTSYIDTLSPVSVITSTPGFHMCYFGFNLRLNWMNSDTGNPQNGGEPGQTLRKAIAHLVPKDTLIATLFKYIVVRLDSFAPPSLGEWYEPSGTVYDYNPKAAYDTLIAGGWRYDSLLGTWYHDANGNGVYDLGERVAGSTIFDPLAPPNAIEIISPMFADAPTSFTIVATLVNEMNALRNPYTGAATPLKAWQDATPAGAIIPQVFQTHTFEMYFYCWLLDKTPVFLYRYFHSSNDITWGGNSPGIHNDALDDLLEIVEFGLDHAQKVQAAKQAQIMLCNLLPYIPVYSRNFFNAHQKDVYGIVLTPGEGIGNDWSYTNAKGKRASTLFVPPLTSIAGNETIWHNLGAVDSYNPAQAWSVYAWRVLDNIYDGLIATNPYTGEDKPWLAKSWNAIGPVTMITPHGANMVNGMYVVFTLDDRVVENKVLWHDGEVFNASDIIFSWKYIWDNELTNFYTFWQHLIDVDSPSPNRVVAYWNTTSQWLIYDGARTAPLFAPQVWGKIDTDFDGQNYLDQGDIEGDTSIRAWTPETKARSLLGAYPAQGAFPWLTQVVGSGPYVLYNASVTGFDTNLFAFDLRAHSLISPPPPMPNLHYWKTKGEIKEQKIEDFYHIGDATIDFSVDISDLSMIGRAYGKRAPGYPNWTPPPGPSYKGFRQEDIVHDGIINILDVATAGKNYGKEGEY